MWQKASWQKVWVVLLVGRAGDHFLDSGEGFGLLVILALPLPVLHAFHRLRQRSSLRADVVAVRLL